VVEGAHGVHVGDELPAVAQRERQQRGEPVPGNRVADQRDGQRRIGRVAVHALLRGGDGLVDQAAPTPVFG
jgi:hypothetical protein